MQDRAAFGGVCNDNDRKNKSSVKLPVYKNMENKNENHN